MYLTYSAAHSSEIVLIGSFLYGFDE